MTGTRFRAVDAVTHGQVLSGDCGPGKAMHVESSRTPRLRSLLSIIIDHLDSEGTQDSVCFDEEIKRMVSIHVALWT